MDNVTIGLVGAGFAASIHARMYHELDVPMAGVLASTVESGQRFADQYGVKQVYANLDEMLTNERIQIIDLCVPNSLHRDFAIQAAQAGKHIICEKPLTGYFGHGAERAGDTPRQIMLAEALADADAMLDACTQSGVKMMYAENWIYAPAIAKVKRLIKASGGTIFEIRAEESHHGSQSEFSKYWKATGGGSLIRLGAHPIGAMLHLKRCEGLWRDGTPITVRSILADVGDLTQTPSFKDNPSEWILTGWDDVENWATAVMTFSDGTKGVVSANDVCLGGMKDTMEIYMSNARIQCNMSRNTAIEAYAPSPDSFADEYLVEKLETKAGWSFPAVDEEWELGYLEEIRDFVEAVRQDREPLSDGQLARDVVNVIYGAYLSAEQGRPVKLD